MQSFPQAQTIPGTQACSHTHDTSYPSSVRQTSRTITCSQQHVRVPLPNTLMYGDWFIAIHQHKSPVPSGFPHRLSNKHPRTSLDDWSTSAGICGRNPRMHRQMGHLPSQMQISRRHRNTCLPDCYSEWHVWPGITASLVKVSLAPRNWPLLFKVQLLNQLGVLLCLQKLFPSLHPFFPLKLSSEKNNTAELIA